MISIENCVYALLYLPRQYLTDLSGGGSIILEKAANVDPGNFYETTAIVGNTSLLAISTLTPEINFYSRLLYDLKKRIYCVSCEISGAAINLAMRALRRQTRLAARTKFRSARIGEVSGFHRRRTMPVTSTWCPGCGCAIRENAVWKCRQAFGMYAKACELLCENKHHMPMYRLNPLHKNEEYRLCAAKAQS